MALTVVTPAASTALTTKARVALELSGIGETLADALIAEASAAIVRYTHRPFAREDYKETVAAFGGSLLQLSRTPIVSVATVARDGEVILDFTIDDADAGQLRRDEGGSWPWSAGLAWNLTATPAPFSEEPRFTVEYTAGYLLPEDVGRDLPEDIERACIELVRAVFMASGRDPAVTREQLGDFSISFAQPGADGGLPPRVVTLLAPWRRFA